MDKIGRPKTDILYPSNFDIRDGVKQLQDKYITIWREILENSEKLSFYWEIKSNYEPENYLITATDNLLIERGPHGIALQNYQGKNIYVQSAQNVD